MNAKLKSIANSLCYECETKIYCQFLRRGVL